MKMVLALGLVVVLASCAARPDNIETSSGLCKGLKTPIDNLADALITYKEETPAPVIRAGAEVIFGYDAGAEATEDC